MAAWGAALKLAWWKGHPVVATKAVSAQVLKAAVQGADERTGE